MKLSVHRYWLRIWLSLSLTACSAAERYPESDHYRGEVFFNPNPIESPGFFAIASHILFGRNGQWKNQVTYLPKQHTKDVTNKNQITITPIGHATVLVQLGKYNIVTDPVWSEKVGPFSWAGPQRAHAPGISFEQLPHVDVVVVSHNHFDHMDLPTLKRLSERDAPQIYVPLGNRNFLMQEGIQNVIEMDWWTEAIFDQNLKIVLTRAQHGSGRGLFDQGRTLWGGFWLSHQGRSVFFGGDTAYDDHFKETKQKLGQPDVALLPIGAYKPREKMRRFHLDPEDSVRAATDLGTLHVVPIHYNCFQLTAENFDEPLVDLQAAIRDAKLDPKIFKTLDPGSSMSF